jgi:hypothetical protein
VVKGIGLSTVGESTGGTEVSQARWLGVSRVDTDTEQIGQLSVFRVFNRVADHECIDHTRPSDISPLSRTKVRGSKMIMGLTNGHGNKHLGRVSRHMCGVDWHH